MNCNCYKNDILLCKRRLFMKEKRFEVREKEGNAFSTEVKIIVDKNTGVNYIFASSGYAGGLTVLLDEDGKPIITK